MLAHLFLNHLYPLKGPSIKDVRMFSGIFDTPSPCPHISTFGWHPSPTPVRADTNLEYNTEFFSKNPTPNIHFRHPSPYRNTKNVSHKAKYLLTTLIQDENIYLKISYGNRKYLFYRTYILFCMSRSTQSPDSNKHGVPSVWQFDKNLGQHLI